MQLLFITFSDRVDRCDASVNQDSSFKSLADQSKILVTSPLICVLTWVVSALKGLHIELDPE